MNRENTNISGASFINILRRLFALFLFIYSGYLNAQTNYFKVIGGIPHLPVFANTSSVSSPTLGMLIYSTADAKPMLYTGETNGWQDLCTSLISSTTAQDYFKVAGGIPYMPSKSSPTGTSPVAGSICYSTGSSAVMVYSGASWIKVSEMSTGTFTTSSNFQSFGSDIKTCKIPVLNSNPAPSGLTTGAIYVNSTSKTIAYFDGSSWQNVSCGPPSIVTNGLILWLDASDASSYSGSGTTWHDLSASNVDATMKGTVTFGGAGTAKYFWFPGNDADYFITSTSQYYKDFTAVIDLNFSYASDASGLTMLFSTNADKSARFQRIATSPDTIWSMRNPGDVNDWANPSSTSYYRDGAKHDTLVHGWNIFGGYRTNYSNFTDPFAVRISGGYNSRNWKGKIAILLMYNRQLSAAEQQQNYNALKARFGLP